MATIKKLKIFGINCVNATIDNLIPLLSLYLTYISMNTLKTFILLIYFIIDSHENHGDKILTKSTIIMSNFTQFK